VVQTADDTLATTDLRGAGETALALGRYRLVRRLGAGAFGVVWLAHDERLDRVVAVKRIELHDEHVAARAEREALAAARLQHPGIVALYEAGRDSAAVYLVSEMVRGRTLADLTDVGALSDRDILRIGAALCDALEHAHTRGVVHRDVKPANIMIPEQPSGEAGIAKLTDFGVAAITGDEALTRTGDVVGTLAYMAPEQAEGHAADGPADLYAVALVLYEALSGVNPVRAPGAAATARRVGTRLPPLARLRRDLPGTVCAGIDRAVLPRPHDRGTLEELREALDSGLEDAGRSPGTVAGPAGERRPPVAPRPLAPQQFSPAFHELQDAQLVPPRAAPAITQRAVAAAAAAALVAAVVVAAPSTFAPGPGAALAGAAATALAVLLLPRLGWLAAAACLVAWLVATGAPGAAVLVTAAALPTMLLLPRDGVLWSAPALAPLLGLAGLALGWPALGGQARGWSQRAALGGLGLWWLVLAEALAPGRLLLGDPPGTAGRILWEESASRAVTDVLVPIISSGVPLIAALWAAAAWVLPLIVRGRAPLVDVVLVTGWATGLAAGTAALVASLPWTGAQPEPRGLVVGAIAAGAIGLLGAAARAPATVRGVSP